MKLIPILLIFIGTSLQAQDSARRAQLAQNWVDAYNAQNYRKMKKPFMRVAKLLPLKKYMRRELEPQYKLLGRVSIDTIRFYPNHLVAVLRFEKDSMDSRKLSMYFNKRNRVEGMGMGWPDFLYAKQEEKLQNANRDKDMARKIDSLVKHRYENDGFNGAVLVMNHGSILYKNSYGYADFDTKTPLNDSSVFEMASVSKQFTAMAIMMLAERGKLRLDDSIQRFIPGFPYKNITIENLLTHTSGLPDYMDLVHLYWDKKKIINNEHALKLLMEKKPKAEFEPGKSFSYCNTGYMLLAVIVEKASGRPFNDFMGNEIFRPLGMQHTLIYDNMRAAKELIPNYAIGYHYDTKKKKYILPETQKRFRYVYYLDGNVGDGKVNTTISDIALWENALRSHKLISDTMWNRACSPYKLYNGEKTAYGYGLFLQKGENKENIVWHGGAWPGYYNVLIHFLDRETSIAIFTNNRYDNFMHLADSIVKIVLTED